MPDLVYDALHVFTPTDGRLGRHVRHDPRSRAYSLAARVPPKLPTVAIDWHRDGDVFDQLDLGCCTAAATLGMMMTGPFSTGVHYTLDDVHDFYHAETVLDGFRDTWPPTDTGSDGLAAMKVLRARGLATSYLHAFDPTVAVAALANGPIIIGVPWLASMFEPRNGLLVVDQRSTVDGGHEVCVDGWDPRTQRVRLTNSWGAGWGRDGRAWFRFSDFAWLLSQQGDAAQPVL